MRESWQRDTAHPMPPESAVAALLARHLPGRALREMVPTTGGLANTNLRLRLADGGDVLLRLWQRDGASAAKEVALLRRLAGIVPVPGVLGFEPAAGPLGPPAALLEFVHGETLAAALAHADPPARHALGRAVGAALAAIHAVPFPQRGFLSATLEVATPLDLGRAGLTGWLTTCLVEGAGRERIAPALRDALFALAEREGDRLNAGWAGGTCLSHADFNPTNLLVRPAGEGWTVAAVLDWEFAFAGGPAFDVAHLLRPPTGEDADFLAGLAAATPDLPADWRALARLADLYAWADFLARPAAGPALIADSLAMLARIAGHPSL